MSALAASRSTDNRGDEFFPVNIPVKASTKVYVGSLCAVDSSGWGVPASDTAGLIVLGRCEGTPPPGLAGLDADNSAGANGAVTMLVKRGLFKFANGTSGEALTAADIGKTCYVVDDQTVGKVGGTNKVVAGTVMGLESAATEVWVNVKGARVTGYTQTQDDLTDNSGGSASTTIAAISDTATKNAVASIVAELAKAKADIKALLK
jgi:hypothetical protein